MNNKYGYTLIDEALDKKIWDKVIGEYSFCSHRDHMSNWIYTPKPSATFALAGWCWDEEQEKLINSFFIKLGISELYALDWQHDCFIFSPDNFDHLVREYDDEDRGCRVYFPGYYPNGDFHFFVDTSWKTGFFGHPWKQELVVYGKELIELFEANSVALGITLKRKYLY